MTSERIDLGSGHSFEMEDVRGKMGGGGRDTSRAENSMSIYASSFSIDSQWPDEGPGPIIYEASHILPAPDSPRGGSLDCAHIPDHIVRGEPGEKDYKGPGLCDYLRIGISEQARARINQYPGSADVILDREQIGKLRDYLNWWLDAEERP